MVTFLLGALCGVLAGVLMVILYQGYLIGKVLLRYCEDACPEEVTLPTQVAPDAWVDTSQQKLH